MPQTWTDRLARWKFRNMYPNVRRKDAGYIANILAEYATFSLEERSRLRNFDDVERCASALLRALDETPEGDRFRAAQLRAALEKSTPPATSGDASAEADPIADKAWLQGYMRQIFEVENAVLQLQGFTALVSRAPFLVERFRIVGGENVDYLKRQYDQDLSSDKLAKLWDVAKSQPGPGIVEPTPDERWIRAKLTSLLNDIHWWYAQSQVREELFLGQQLTVIGAFVVLSFALLVAFATGCNCNNKLTVAVMFFGLLGGFTSVMRRMRSDTPQHGGGTEGSYKELTAFAYGKIGITFSLVFGVIFALVLLLLFSAGLQESVFNTNVSKLIFPSLPITWGEDGKCSARCLFELPLASADVTKDPAKELAKMFIWAFIAGFAETLVPDALDRLTKAAAPKK